jgi:hypothetical protein
MGSAFNFLDGFGGAGPTDRVICLTVCTFLHEERCDLILSVLFLDALRIFGRDAAAAARIVG